jgi:hypothetical protein
MNSPALYRLGPVALPFTGFRDDAWCAKALLCIATGWESDGIGALEGAMRAIAGCADISLGGGNKTTRENGGMEA